MVLEYNCRLGDPETQPIMMRMDFDLAVAFEAVASRTLDRFKPAWKPGASVCVVMASGGYPGAFETGKKITGLAEAAALPDVAVFHAGTKREGDSIVTSGGRVLGVTAAADSLPQAIHKAYEAVDKIHFDGAQYRTDIGAKGDLRRRVAGGGAAWLRCCTYFNAWRTASPCANSRKCLPLKIRVSRIAFTDGAGAAARFW